MARAVFAFTRDLRLGDHAGLAAAARHGEVVPVHVVDPGSAARLRRSPRRAAYYCAALGALDADLRAQGSRLIVRRGNPGPVLRALARAAGADLVGWSCGYDAKSVRAERDLQSTLEEAGLRALPVHDALVVQPEDAAAGHHRGDGYRAFVPYHARWRTQIPADDAGSASAFARLEIASEPLPVPAEFGSQAALEGEVGEAAARAKLTAYLAGPVLQYGIARNVPAAGGTSRLSAELSFGTLAGREVVRAACARAADPFLLVEERTSLKLFLRSLAQRDFFLQLAYYNESLEEQPLQAKMRGFAFARSHPALDAWRSGRTGFPLVDAGIRELRATGWMHPRLRAIAASFLCFDLGVDWRVGRDEWDTYLIEDAPALAVGNWQWIAGVGADLAAYPRIYNPLKQARRFDPSAQYVRRWIPELAGIPDDAVLDPLEAPRRRQLDLPLYADRGYPAPVLDHGQAARAFLARYAREVRAPA
ncbi:MAG: deoxyribodipyrimidine photo-lyase [Candidatus Eremiobacteraeota bacterium]|jgi:deoxyribodipyrimidine photo-lyase|nr:deoxyribodipyrimidine photo-lyase [Candidatus Eremiobacteraeota bacterium]